MTTSTTLHVFLHIAEIYAIATLGILVGIGIGPGVFVWLRKGGKQSGNDRAQGLQSVVGGRHV